MPLSQPRVLTFTMPTSGHLAPLVPVLGALTAAGAQVWCTSTPRDEARLREQGARTVPFLAGLAETAEEPAAGLAEICRRLAEATETAYPWARQLISELDPDVVLVDSIAPWGRLAAAEAGVPAVCSCSTFVIHRGLDSSLSAKLRVVSEVVSGLPDLVQWARTRRRTVRTLGVDPGSPVDMLAGRADRTMAYLSREVQPGADALGADVVYVGSPVEPASPEHPDLADLPDGPLVYVSLGTRLNDRPDFLRTCLEAFADHPGPVLLSIGQRTDPQALGPLPGNAIVRRFVPQLAVLARASLFVTHGGMNSASEALVHGVPLVIYPQTADQPRVAARLEQLGAATVLRGSHPSVTDIRTAAAQAQSDAVRARVRALGEGLQLGGAARAAEVVLELAGTRPAAVST